LLIFLFSFYSGFTQCIINAYASRYQICTGEAVSLYAAGSCGNVKNTTFNELSLPAGWLSCCNSSIGTFCGSSLDNSPYFWFGAYSTAIRYLQSDTFQIDTTGCMVHWEMKYGDVQGDPDCDPPEDSTEGVHLQYSLDYGFSWKDLGYWPANSNTQGPQYVWNNYNKAIPDSMIGHNNMMRWVQLNNSGLGFDHWGLDNISISCPDISLITWSTGDTGASGGTVYPVSDTFYIVTIEDTLNNISTCDTVFIKVHPIPLSDFTIDNNIVCEGEKVKMTYLGNAATSANYLWNFSGGIVASGSGQGPVDVYWNNPGNYTISLKVTDDNCPSQLSDTSVSVKPIPLITIYTATYSGCQPLQVDYYNISTPININCFWNFGDGNTSIQSNPTHIYKQHGTYNLTFIGTSQYGCSDTLILPGFTNVYLKPIADFIANDFNVSIQNPVVHFTDMSSADVVSHFWDFGDLEQSSSQNPTHVYSSLGDYDVKLIVSNSNDCKDTIVKKVLVTLTDIPDEFVDDTDITILTLGSQGNLKLLINGLSGYFHFSIYNSNSQLIGQQEIRIPEGRDNYETEFDLPGILNGIYFLHVWNNEKSFLKKFIVD
ncbi:PKD domain-containing protein, partial [candidate division KSB1 bacterium]